MWPAYEESSARLARLLDLATKETNPMVYDELAAEIRRVLDEREQIRNRLRHVQPDQE
jgi:flagellar biosynthesis chaperone FliJ